MFKEKPYLQPALPEQGSGPLIVSQIGYDTSDKKKHGWLGPKHTTNKGPQILNRSVTKPWVLAVHALI